MVILVVVKTVVAGSDVSGKDSGGGPKVGIWKERSSSNNNCYLHFYCWDSLRRIEDKRRIPFEKSGALIRCSWLIKYGRPSVSTVSVSMRTTN